MFDALDVSATGLTAERLRMDVTAENLANAQTTRGADGQPYRRKEVVLSEISSGGFGSQLAKAIGAGSKSGAIGARPPASRSRPSRRTRRPASSSTTPATPTPTRRAMCACRTSTRSPRWST